MINNKKAKILNYFSSEPFTRREAWKWLLECAKRRTNPCKVVASASTLAREWKWHKSKVERFIRFLRNETLIETTIDECETCLTICISNNHLDIQTKSGEGRDEITETVSETKANFSSVDSSKRYRNRDYMKQLEIKRIPSLYETLLSTTETLSIQNQDIYFPKKKKEKYQKKEKEEEDLKEKNIPYGDIKKEKIYGNFHDQLNALQLDDMAEFAASIGLDSKRLELELAEFKSNANRYTILPKDAMAAFRNWLRRSVECEHAKSERSRRLQALPPISFEEFMATNIRKIAEQRKEREVKEIDQMKLINTTENG